ncbi:hypothetical protein LWC34_22035 [Kibdelosporangium philippinense]|uniref:Uncharacterized protein n=1 Tax=Kibdelosporangium philippinense TaxID=211113 RepID=A0ABS8ZDF0_9PSEU|nr:hypothetical protein [Kibdelosporangium philippinense]MCE7005482.1 hypothetical protein [Kibdelosporangium philippinense]
MAVDARRRFIGWQTFFDFGDGQVRPNKRIDTRISTALFNLPLQTTATGDPPTALPQRNLLRHVTWSLPSGQAIARAMGIPVLGQDSFPELRQFNVGFDANTPLWYYIRLPEGYNAYHNRRDKNSNGDNPEHPSPKPTDPQLPPNSEVEKKSERANDRTAKSSENRGEPDFVRIKGPRPYLETPCKTLKTAETTG